MGGVLGGGGSIAGTVTVNSGGVLAPGASAGQLDTGTLVLNAGSTFSVEIGGITPETQYDQVNVTGGISLAGALAPTFINGFTPTTTDRFWIGLNDGVDPISGTFSNAPITNIADNSGVFNFGGVDYTVYYSADFSGDTLTGGNDLLLIAVPEPGSAALLLGGMATLLGLRRQRRRA